jgi:RimJ/RimL family protein N-acetyltransferase
VAHEDAKVGVRCKPLFDPAVVFASDLALVDVGLGGIDGDKRNVEPGGLEAQLRIARAEGVLVEHIADVARVVVAGNPDDLRRGNCGELLLRERVLVGISVIGEVAGDDDEIGLGSVDFVDRGVQQLLVKATAADMDVGELCDQHQATLTRVLLPRRTLHGLSARLEPQYPLETERLLLRPFVAEDFEALLAIYSRAEVARYLYSGPMSEDEVRASLERKIGQTAIRAERENLSLAVVLKATSELIGACTLFYLSSLHRQGEIGFVFHPDHHGRGFATEAARLLLRLAFEELDLHRVIGRLEARNTASARVLERLGMRQEAHFVENEFVKGEWQSELVFALLAREWRAFHT